MKFLLIADIAILAVSFVVITIMFVRTLKMEQQLKIYEERIERLKNKVHIKEKQK